MRLERQRPRSAHIGSAMVGDQICTENFVYDANQHKMLGHALDLQLMYTV